MFYIIRRQFEFVKHFKSSFVKCYKPLQPEDSYVQIHLHPLNQRPMNF